LPVQMILLNSINSRNNKKFDKLIIWLINISYLRNHEKRKRLYRYRGIHRS
jgi:hypothetical protein